MLLAFCHDLRHAFRLLRRSPRETAIAAAILGLGIGANTAMFSAVNHVLWRPFPFPDEMRLIRVREMTVDADGRPHPFNMSSRAILALSEGANDVFDGLVAMGGSNRTLDGPDGPERVSVVLQTEGFERTLRVNPILGRPLTPDEERRGLDAGVALISHALWQTRFGGLSSAIGTPVRLDDRTFTIVGVMPPQYAFPYDAQFWIPWRLDAADQQRDFAVWAHEKPGVTGEQVRSAVDRVAAALRRTYVALPAGYTFELTSIRENLVDNQNRPLLALAEIVTLMLIIAAVNVATLLVARSIPRRREFAVRAALGQTRARQASQLLAESVALALVGCAAGLLLTAWLSPLTASLVPAVLKSQLGLTTPKIDWHVAAFAGVVSIASAVVAGLVPALGSWRTDLTVALGGSSRTTSQGRRARSLSAALVVAETALTLVLLVGAGLIIRNFVRLQTDRLGFDAHGLLTIELTPPAPRYADPVRRVQLVRRLVDELSPVSRVGRAAITTVNPLGGGTWGASVISAEAAERDPNAALNSNYRLITPGLFQTMGIGLLRGRDFSWSDRVDTPPVVIISELLAERLWPGAEAVGRRLRLVRPGAPWLTVVGVADNVSDTHEPGVPRETIYMPYAQRPESAAAEHVYVMLRDGGDPLTIVGDVRRAIARVDPTLAPYAPAAMDAYYSESIARERTSAAFMAAFGAFGLLLAALGVYGVMALGVAQRTTEFGIRMALGASLRDIVPAVLSGQLALVGAGLGLGTLAALLVGRAVEEVLPGAGALDTALVAGASLLLVTTAALACAVPLRSLGRIDPAAALKAE